MTRSRREGIKRGERNLHSNQFPKCSPQPRTPKEIHKIKYRREGGGRRVIEVTRRRIGAVKRAETNLASNQFLKCSPQPRTPKEIHRVK